MIKHDITFRTKLIWRVFIIIDLLHVTLKVSNHIKDMERNTEYYKPCVYNNLYPLLYSKHSDRDIAGACITSIDNLNPFVQIETLCHVVKHQTNILHKRNVAYQLSILKNLSLVVENVKNCNDCFYYQVEK